MEDDEEMEDNDKANTHNKVISALELDRDVGFSPGHQANQGYQPHDDDNEEENNTVEENNKEDDNNKDDNNDIGISAQGLDTALGFFRGHQGHQRHQP